MRARVPDAAAFPLKAVGWSLGLFALIRSPWVEGSFVLPLTRWQQGAAEFYAGAPKAPISVTADCSGTEVLALCLAAILAWPASWRMRLAGALGGITLILTVNTFRIGTLGLAAASPALFDALHLQIWPAILVLVTTGYVFAWMKMTSPPLSPLPGDEVDRAEQPVPPIRRFAMLAVFFLLAFAFSGPWIARSEALLAISVSVASASALVLGAIGIAATAAGPVLATSRGAFMVTPECLATALVPLYFAGIFAAPLSWVRRTVAILVAPPIFASLAIARLLLLALPPVVAASPLFLVHGFHQFVLAVMVVGLVAWGHEAAGPVRLTRASMRALKSLATGFAFAMLAGDLLARAVTDAAGAVAPGGAHALSELVARDDSQGALATLAAFQASLLIALAVAWAAPVRRAAGTLAILVAGQVACVVALGEIALTSGVLPHALLLRAWAVGLPGVLAFTAFSPRHSPRHSNEAPEALRLVHDPA